MTVRINWASFSADPRARAAATVRASDADRDAALTVLGEAYADGRLDRIEYDARSSAALRAVVLGDLKPLLLDLEPPLPAVVTKSPRERAVAQYRQERVDARNGALLVSAVTTAIWAATSVAAGQFLFFWPAFPIVVLTLGWIGQITGRDKRTDRLEERFARRDARRRKWAARRRFSR